MPGRKASKQTGIFEAPAVLPGKEKTGQDCAP
jgi:hypothetical protein